MSGRIDVHSHLIPGVDDGSASLEETLACARVLVENGYTHTFLTPHIWKSFPQNTRDNVVYWTDTLSQQFKIHEIPLTVMPGGEMTLTPTFMQMQPEYWVTYGMQGKFMLFDLWADALPPYFESTVNWIQSKGIQPILAHPERMRAVQLKPQLADDFKRMGLWMQGNLQCLSDEPNAATRLTMERFLKEDRYFMFGSDLHKLDTLPARMNGLKRAIELVGEAKVDEMTKINPAKLI